MEEGGEPEHQVGRCLVHHCEGVGQNVLVELVRVLLHGQGGQLGDEVVGEPGGHHHSQRPSRGLGHHQLGELVPDPLRGHDPESVPHRLHRGDGVGVGLESECGLEPEEAEHPQRIVGERDLGIERGPQHTLTQVGEPAVGIDRRHVHQGEGDGVDREVATGEVGLDVVRIGDPGLARVAPVDLVAIGRHLHGAPVPLCGDRAERSPHGVDHLRPPVEDPRRLLGSGVGGEVEVEAVDVPLQERVPDRAPDQVQLVTLGVEQLRQLRRRKIGRDQKLETGRDHPGRLSVGSERY